MHLYYVHASNYSLYWAEQHFVLLEYMKLSGNENAEMHLSEIGSKKSKENGAQTNARINKIGFFYCRLKSYYMQAIAPSSNHCTMCEYEIGEWIRRKLKRKREMDDE